MKATEVWDKGFIASNDGKTQLDGREATLRETFADGH